jgi:hypothetical protein
MEVTAQTQPIEALQRLESTLKEISAFLSRHGIEKSGAISETNREIFLNWPAERLEKTVETTSKILQVHLEAEQRVPFDIDDCSHLLHLAVKSMGLSIDSSFYEQVSRSDIVEIYGHDHVQIFRSFNFFRICSYDLDDVLSHQWFELYERDESITNALLETWYEHIGSSRSVTKMSVAPHVMRERFSKNRNAVFMKFKYIATIYSGPAAKDALIVTSDVQPLGDDGAEIEFIGSKRTTGHSLT